MTELIDEKSIAQESQSKSVKADLGRRGESSLEVEKRSLRCMARRANTARKKKPGHSGRDDRCLIWTVSGEACVGTYAAKAVSGRPWASLRPGFLGCAQDDKLLGIWQVSTVGQSH